MIITAQEITKLVQRCWLVDAPLTDVFLKMQMIKISPEVTPAPKILSLLPNKERMV